MKSRYLLDTHILLWWLSKDKRLSKSARKVIHEASESQPLFLAEISLWEIAMLETLGRIRVAGTLRDWLESATAAPLIIRQGITPAIAAEVAQLPKDFQRDPADRIIAATGRVLDLTVITCDKRIISSQLVKTLS